MRTTLKEIKKEIDDNKAILFWGYKKDFIKGEEYGNVTVEVAVGREFAIINDAQDFLRFCGYDVEKDFYKLKCVKGGDCGKCVFWSGGEIGHCYMATIRGSQGLDILCREGDRKDKQEVHFEEVK